LSIDVVIEPAAFCRVDQSYPLARLARPNLTLAEWRRGAEQSAADAGLVLAVDAGDRVRGLCSYRVRRGACDAGVLEAEVFAAAHPFDTRPFVAGLLDALERLAVDSGCESVEFAGQDYDRWLRQADARRDVVLRRKGYPN
jgi:hypothetical protein